MTTLRNAACEAASADLLDDYIMDISHDELVQLVRDLRISQPRIDLSLEVGAALYKGGPEAVISVNVNRAKGTELMFALVDHFAEAGDLPSYKRMESELRDIRKFVTDDAAAQQRFTVLANDLRNRYTNRAAVLEIIDRI